MVFDNLVLIHLAMLKIINNLADKISVSAYIVMQISSMYIGHEAGAL